MLRSLAAGLVVVALLSACGDDATDPLSRGRTIYGDVCSVCHGSAGNGGVGPSLDTVVEVWPDCEDQIEWITLGSDGWKAAYGDTYGATDREVAGGMPAQGGTLTPEEIRLVAAFERTQYGGQEQGAAMAQCGVPPPPTQSD